MTYRGDILYTAADVRDAVLAVAEAYGIAPAAALRIAAREVPEVSGDATASARSDADELPPLVTDHERALMAEMRADLAETDRVIADVRERFGLRADELPPVLRDTDPAPPPTARTT